MSNLVKQNKAVSKAEHQQAMHKFVDEMRILAQTKGKEHAQSGNKPQSADEFQILFGNRLSSEYQTFINENHRVYAPISDMVGAQEHKKRAEQEVQKQNAEKLNLQVEKAQLEALKKSLLPDGRLKRIRRWILAALVAVGAIEGIYVFGALQSKGLGVLTAISTGVVVAIIVSICTHLMAGVLKRTKKKTAKIIRWTLTLFIPALFFYWVATWRVEGYAIENQFSQLLPGFSAAKTPLNVWGFAGISYIIYLAGLCISYYFAKTSEEKQRQTDCNIVTAQLESVQQKEKTIDDTIAAIEKEKEEVLYAARKNYEEAVASEQQLISNFHGSAEVYKDANVLFRPDKQVPLFFKGLYPFTPKRFFDTIKSNNNTHGNN